MATAQVHCNNCAYMLKDFQFTQWSKAELRSYINKAVRAIARQICQKHPEFWLSTGQASQHTYTVAAGTQDYALPADFFGVISVNSTDSEGAVTEVYPLSPSQARESGAEGYQLVGGSLRIWPVPSSDGPANGLELLYVSTPSEVAADGDIVPLGDTFGDLIELYAVNMAKMRQQQDWRAFGALMSSVRSELDHLIARRNMAVDAGLSVDVGPTI